MTINRTGPACAVLAVLLAAAPPSLAQHEAESQATSQRDEIDPVLDTIVLSEDTPGGPELEGRIKGEIESIIVTATKRKRALRDIPASITVLSEEELRSMGAADQEDFLKLVPGVSLTLVEPNQNRVTIRGVAEDFGTSQAAGILIDEAPFSDPFVADMSPDLDPFDLETVEVLKGPQGTLFGASGLAGAVRYVPNQPDPTRREIKGYYAMEAAHEGEIRPRYGLAANLPLYRDQLTLRLVGSQRRRPGYVDEIARAEADVNHSRHDALRGLLNWQATPDLSIDLLSLRQDTAIHDTGTTDNTEGRLERDRYANPSPTSTDFGLDSLKLRWERPWASIVSVSARVSKLLDTYSDLSNVAPGAYALAFAKVDGQMQELRLLSPEGTGDWDWLAGLFYYRYDNFRVVQVFPTDAGGFDIPTIPGTVGLSGPQTGLLADYTLDAVAREIAAFGELTWYFASRWEASLGLRWFVTRSDGVASGSGPLNIALSGEQEFENNGRIREQGLNPKLSLRFAANEQITVYALASRGFRFGGFALIADTPTDDVPEVYKSDTLWMYELGLRSQWLDRSLIADLAVYHIDWRDPQITQLTDSQVLTYVDNVGGSRVDGLDLQLSYRPPIAGLKLGVSLSWTDARTTEAFVAADGSTIPPGSRWPFSADFQSAATLDYERELGSWQLGGGLTYVRTGDGVANLQNTTPVFDYETWDLRLSLSRPDHSYWPGLNLNVGNLRDTRGVARRVDAGDDRAVTYIRPRTVTLQLALSF
ncbi:MAG: TonB-dependent receptor [Oceanococcus sp.]